MILLSLTALVFRTFPYKQPSVQNNHQNLVKNFFALDSYIFISLIEQKSPCHIWEYLLSKLTSNVPANAGKAITKPSKHTCRCDTFYWFLCRWALIVNLSCVSQLELLVLHSNLLLCDGDISPNPGPVTDPCGICSKPVKKNQKGIACDNCNTWFHVVTRCIELTNDEYYIFQTDSSKIWVCPKCSPNVDIETNPIHANPRDTSSYEDNPLDISDDPPRVSGVSGKSKKKKKSHPICPVCDKNVYKNHRQITCNTCNFKLHAKCANLDKPNYVLHKNNPKIPFICFTCSLPKFSDELFHEFVPELQPCSINDIENITSGFAKYNSVNGFKVCHINTGNGGLLYHLDSVVDVIDSFVPDVLAISETWIDVDTDFNLFNIAGDSFVHFENDGTFQGKQGVAFYIKTQYHFKIREDLHVKNLMSISIEILSLQKYGNIIVTALYRHPHSAIEYLQYIESLFVKLDCENSNSIITGDFNCNYRDVSIKGSLAYKLNDIAILYGFKQLINSPTRITANSSTIIDLTFVNHEFRQVHHGVAVVSVADHLLNYIVLGDYLDKSGHKFIYCRNYKKLDSTLFHNAMQDTPWYILHNIDINESFKLFNIMFMSQIDKFAPYRKKCIKKNKDPWHRKEIDDLKKYRDFLHTNAITSGDFTDWEIYLDVKKQVNANIAEAKKQYFLNGICESRGNTSKMWKFLTRILPGKLNNVKFNVYDDSQNLVSDPKMVVSLFNSFFIDIGRNLASKIAPTGINYLIYLRMMFGNIKSSFCFTSVSEEDVAKIINNLDAKKATGHDGISVKLLKTCNEFIVPHLTIMLNNCISKSIFPDVLKIARINPIFKSGDSSVLSNYRPISILPVLSKVLERLLHKQLYNYFVHNNIFYINQSGFRIGFSTQYSLHNVFENIYANINNGLYTGVIALDLKKAFDTVNFEILLDKLKFYGLDNNSLRFMSSYLSNRKQYVNIDGCKSSEEVINTGVPQGSILGPLLFIIYINDIPSVVSKSSINIYADDTAIYFANANLNIVQETLQHDMNNIYSWLKTNKLSLNLSKTVCMIITTRQMVTKNGSPNVEIKLDDCTIENVNVFKYLGLHMDRYVNFDIHINEMCKKISRAIGVFKYACKFVPLNTRKMLYYSFIHTYFEYCATLWCNTSQHNLNRLQILQNRAMRIVLRCHSRTHIHDMLESLNLMNIRKNCKFQTCILMYKMQNNLLPRYLNFTSEFTQPHNYNLRSTTDEKLYVNRNHINSLTVNGALLWNAIPINIRHSTNIVSFKAGLKTFIWDSMD